jgi:hypothetical protein
MINHIEKFCNEFGFPVESRDALLSTYNKIIVDKESNELLSTAIRDYQNNYNCDYKKYLTDCERIAQIIEVHEYTVKLLLFVTFSKALKEHYIKNGYDDQLYYSTMLDLKYKLIECKLVKGVDGTYVANWLTGFFALTRFGFNRLQFEIRPAKLDYTSNGNSIKAGDPVINVHIPRTGTPLTPTEFEEDFDKAASFFSESFTDRPIAFVCHSWLLYEKLREFLKETSNIIAFMNKFDIIFTDYLEFGDYSQIWRLFDVDYSGNLDDLPEDSSLRRAYKQYLKDGGKWGAGYGIFFK